MNPTILLLAVIGIMASHYQVGANSLHLNQVVRALDALYKRQDIVDSTTTWPEGGAIDPIDPIGSGGSTFGSGGSTYGSGGISSYGSGEKVMCNAPYELYSSLQAIQDTMFIKNVRESIGSFNGVCMDIMSWLDTHTFEAELAQESEGLGSIPDPAVRNLDSRSTKMINVKRQLRALKRQMMDVGGTSMNGIGGNGVVTPIHDGDIKWHKLFLSCYVWMNLSADDASMVKK